MLRTIVGFRSPLVAGYCTARRPSPSTNAAHFHIDRRESASLTFGHAGASATEEATRCSALRTPNGRAGGVGLGRGGRPLRPDPGLRLRLGRSLHRGSLPRNPWGVGRGAPLEPPVRLALERRLA